MFARREMGSMAGEAPLRQQQVFGWVTFDGSAAALVPVDSENVASLTDNGGVGDYTVTWAWAQPTATYALAGLANTTSFTTAGIRTLAYANVASPLTTTSSRVESRDNAGAGGNLSDSAVVCVIAVGG